MRKLFTATLIIALAAALAASPLLAKDHSFKLLRDSSINGTDLKAGTYKLELSGDNEALIYRNGEMVVKARVEVKPLANGQRSRSVLLAEDGSVREIRLSDKVVVFVR